ncbi:zinc finger protein 729 [Vespula maculifrons]|uniref:Zinc finger protein 729 n=1 Tax=Vespula maculifrons TaxID=7453 RepID=A0ABD2AS90_VESMC
MLPLPSTARISPPGRKMFTTTVGYLGREGKAPLNAPTAWPTNASGFAHTGKQILSSLLAPSDAKLDHCPLKSYEKPLQRGSLHLQALFMTLSKTLDNLRKHILSKTLHPGKTIYECDFCATETNETFCTNFAKELRAHLLDLHSDKFPTSDDVRNYVLNIFDAEPADEPN